HINVDDVVCRDDDTGVIWDSLKGGQRAAVGTIPRPVRLWGTTDVHAHPLANKSFGGHVVWGDPLDDLGTVYRCDEPNPPGGAPPFPESVCRLRADTAILTGLSASGVCGAALAVPIFGPVLLLACHATVIGVLAHLATVGVFEGRRYHGGMK